MVVFCFFLALALCTICGCGPRPQDGSVCIDDWELYLPQTNEWLSVKVPGDVMTDLLQHGRIEDPYLDTNERASQWVENETWVYRTRVLVSDHEAESVLRFEGLDTYASIVVNDYPMLETDNSHRAYEVDLPPSEVAWNIEVILHSPIKRGQAILDAHPRNIPVSNEMKPIGEQTSSVTRKPYYHFGWDWGPRLVSAGISGPVTVVPAEQPLASSNRIHTVMAADGMAVISFEPEHDWPAGSWTLTHPDGNQERIGADPTGGSCTVETPEWWWPNGMGDQPLYRLTWTPASPSLHSLHWNIGLRTIEWVREPDAWGQSFACHVNGVRVQARGANVIPTDFFTVRGSESELCRLQSAVDANMNMVRVWGGASYPSEQFYNFCDSAGLLVWQDFMFACAMVPGDSTYVANVKAEAAYQVKRLRHRPSLALWCGNNESQKAWETWGWPDLFELHGPDSIATEEAYAAVFHQALPSVVERESDAFYWPSSPSRDPLAEYALESGDEHAWHVWFDTLDFDFFSEHIGRFASEYGLQSLPDAWTLSKVGIGAFEDEALQFRQRSKMEWLKPGLDGWGMMRIYARRYAADPVADDTVHTPLERWIYLTQFTQALGLREALERHRTSDGRYAGSLYWQLSDVWPTVSWSTVDYYGRWKLAHHAVQQANKPRCVQRAHGRSTETLFAFNDSPEALESTVLQVALLNNLGDTLHVEKFEVNLPAFYHEVLELGEAFNTPKGILRWMWIDDSGIILDAGTHLHAKPAEVDWPDATIETVWKGDSLVLTSDHIALGVRLQLEGMQFEENGFMLFPNEPKTVGFRTTDSQNAVRKALSVEHFAEYQ
jgi:beta-mannosidase